jgi:uncharacterized protein YjbI with pentapeptide repeats
MVKHERVKNNIIVGGDKEIYDHDANENLLEAAINNDNNLVETMLQNNETKFSPEFVYSSLFTAVYNCNPSMVKLFFKYKGGTIDLLREVDEDGLDSIASNKTILDYAISLCHVNDVVIELLKAGRVRATFGEFNKYNLSRLTLDNINLYMCTIDESILINTTMQNSVLNNITFSYSNLNGIQFIRCDFPDEPNFEHTNLTDARFTNCILQDAIFQFSELNSARFTNCKLDKIFFEGTSLRNTHFINCSLQEIDFDNKDTFEDSLLLNGARFINCDLRNANFMSANVAGVDFTGSYLEGAKFNSTRELAIFDINELLVRSKVRLYKNKQNPFEGIALTNYDPILMEDTNYCEYIKQSPNNLLFFYEKQIGFVNKTKLKQLININTIELTKIVYQCKQLEIAFKPRNENIISEPYLNMDIFGLLGIMLPLSYIDNVINNKHQIFTIEPIGNETQMIIASLNTRMGGNVVGSNHCNNVVNIKAGKLYYVPNDVLFELCKSNTPNSPVYNPNSPVSPHYSPHTPDNPPPQVGGSKRKTSKLKPNSKRKVTNKRKPL